MTSTRHGQPRAPRVGVVGVVGAAALSEMLADLEWSDVKITHDLSGAHLERMSMQRVRCTSAQFVGADLQQARLVDSLFQDCDLAGVRIDEASLQRVEFRNCRMSGAQFNATRLHDARFEGCRLDGASFRMVRGERVAFDECTLTDAEFYAAELADARFEHCDLTTTDFSQARIPDASLSGSMVEGLRGVGGLQRPIIDASQVVPFAFSLMTLYGVVVRADEDDE